MKLIVGVADCRVSNEPGAVIVTYSLGSCIAVCACDPAARVGGMLHFMLPDSRISPEKAEANPSMFADTGIPFLFREVCRLGGHPTRLVVKAVGGSQGIDPDGMFAIGRRNIVAMRKVFWQYGIMPGPAALGGEGYRTATLDVGSGGVVVKMAGNGVHVL